MEKSDFAKFSEYMSILGEIVGDPSTDSRIKIYWKILSRYPAYHVFSGFERLYTQPKLFKFPVPGDIIVQFQEDGETMALKAWGKAKKGIYQAGYMNSIKFDDPVIHSVIRIVFGGWVKFCSLQEDEARFYRPQFLRAYKSLQDAHSQGKMEVLDYLPGSAEIDNGSQGLSYAPPVAISDVIVKQGIERERVEPLSEKIGR